MKVRRDSALKMSPIPALVILQRSPASRAMTTNDQDSDSFKEQPSFPTRLSCATGCCVRWRWWRFSGALFLANDIISGSPPKLMMVHSPAGTSMIATEVASPFLTPFQAQPGGCVLFSIPYTPVPDVGLHRAGALCGMRSGWWCRWSHPAPSFLYRDAVCILCGFPPVFCVFTGTVPDGVTVATDIAKYLDFILTLFFAFRYGVRSAYRYFHFGLMG